MAALARAHRSRVRVALRARDDGRPDFDPSDAIDFWDQVNREDWHVCELTQKGVRVARLHAGPLLDPRGRRPRLRRDGRQRYMEALTVDGAIRHMPATAMLMNEIAAKLGEVGLPEPVSDLAARDWDVIVVGGGHNGLTAAAYLARAGRSVLVLERRERLGGAATLERPFADERFVVSPCAYVVGLLDELVIEELELERRGLALLGRRPEPLGSVRGRHRLRPVARRLEDAGEPRGARRLGEATSRATGPTRSCSTTFVSCCARASATPGWGTRRPAPRSRSSSAAARR